MNIFYGIYNMKGVIYLNSHEFILYINVYILYMKNTHPNIYYIFIYRYYIDR